MQRPKTSLQPKICAASVAHLNAILVWLEREQHESGTSFSVNENTICEAQAGGELRVALDQHTQEPIAFMIVLDEPKCPMIHILAVEAKRRGGGLGTILVSDFLQTAQARDALGVYGQCRPESSEPFWAKMGFEPIDPQLAGHDNRLSKPNWRAMLFGGRSVLPVGVTCASMRIRLSHGDSDRPIAEDFLTSVAWSQAGWILQTHFARCIPNPDVRVRVSLDETEISADKVKNIERIGGERASPFIRVRILDHSIAPHFRTESAAERMVFTSP